MYVFKAAQVSACSCPSHAALHMLCPPLASATSAVPMCACDVIAAGALVSGSGVFRSSRHHCAVSSRAGCTVRVRGRTTELPFRGITCEPLWTTAFAKHLQHNIESFCVCRSPCLNARKMRRPKCRKCSLFSGRLVARAAVHSCSHTALSRCDQGEARPQSRYIR